MTESTGATWRNVVNCAVSNSVHRCKGQAAGLPNVELDCILRYIQRSGHLSAEESKEVMAKSINRAHEQVIADGKSPAWARIGVIIGLVGIGFNIFNFIITGFSFIFLLFLFAAVSIVIPCLKCLSEQKAMGEAAKLWNQGCKAGIPEQLDAALQNMEAVLHRK